MRLRAGGSTWLSRVRRVALLTAYSMPAVAAGIGLWLAPSLLGLFAFVCLAGVALTVARADRLRQRSRVLLDAEGLSPAFARVQFRTVLWLLLGLALFVAPAVVSSQVG
jgi:hypothetical protein